MKSNNTKIIAGIVIAVLVVGGGITWFATSHGSASSAQAAYGNNQGQNQSAMNNQSGQPNGQGQMMASSTRRYGGMMANVPKGGFASGTITSVGASSITITMRDNSTKVVDFTSATVFKKYDVGSASMIPATISDIAIGQRILAIGTPNSDGSVQATTINEGMPMRQRPMNANGQNSGTPPPTSTQ